jgi:site-specific DNA-methyltransferase (adenine-specific)
MVRSLIEGENLKTLRSLAESHALSVTLAYADPPFMSGTVYKTSTGDVAFDDRWQDLPSYLDALERRLQAIKSLMAPWGSVVVHVDPKTSAYVRVMGDRVFGKEAFASEIIWRYRRWPSKTPNFQRVHDVLLRWRADMNDEPRFVRLYEPLAASTLKTWGTGRQLAVIKNGERIKSSTTAEESPGTPMGDVWDIGIVAPVAKERVDFPTQKPERLLDRLVNSLTHRGDLVLDPYCGSGTTLVVAEKLGRSWVGIDSSPVAIRCARARLSELDGSFPLAETTGPCDTPVQGVSS